jgi:hypothetical protein
MRARQLLPGVDPSGPAPLDLWSGIEDVLPCFDFESLNHFSPFLDFSRYELAELGR